LNKNSSPDLFDLRRHGEGYIINIIERH
jgi:hypothetical protein